MNNAFLIRLIEKVSGQGYDPAWSDKIPFILGGLIGLVVLWIFFGMWYWKSFGSDKRLRHLFLATVVILGVFILAKLGVHHFYKDYLGDRWFFYGLPSPRIKGFGWFLLPIGIFSAFFYFRSKIEALSERMFLFVIWFVFVALALSVAGVRDGLLSIVDSLTRTYWEYTGALPFIKGTFSFLHDFISLLPVLPVHVRIHPPGYPLALYFWQELFHVGNLGLAILLVMTAGIVPLVTYFLVKAEAGVARAKRIAMVLIFLPSLVLFSATSMEGLFVGLVWLSLGACYWGWKNNLPLALLGGCFVAYSFFSNFLFALLAPCFVYLLYCLYSDAEKPARKIFLIRVVCTVFVFVLFFVALWKGSGYSIVHNFFIAYGHNNEIVESNFASVITYSSYFLMNVLEFLFYLGIPLVYIFVTSLPQSFIRRSKWFTCGAISLFFFLIIGIFQGEVGRIWLFIAPFFIHFGSSLLEGEDEQSFSAILMLLFLQIMTVQVAFYTFW